MDRPYSGPVLHPPLAATRFRRPVVHGQNIVVSDSILSVGAPAFYSVQEAAEQLNVSAITIRHHIASGRLPASKRSGTWWLDAREVARMRRQPPGAGRPLGDDMAWAVILIASGAPEQAARLAGRDRYILRANAWTRTHPFADHAPRLRARARSERFDAHPSEIARVTARSDVLQTGISAGDEVGLVGASGEAEVYAPAHARHEIVKSHALDPGTGAVHIRWIRDELWPAIEIAASHGRAPRAAILLDLLENDDPRARREAHQALQP
jgi:excisionase family DNA binding protein